MASPATGTGARATWLLSGLYAALFFELGVNLPFFPVWLRSRGLDDAAIGIALSIPPLLRIAANPAAAAFADRSGRIGETLAACAWAVVLGMALLAGAGSEPVILAAIALVALGQGPLIALSDALALSILKAGSAPELRYGRIRLWGSGAFAVASLSGGWLLDRVAPFFIIVMLLGAAIATAVAVTAAPRPAGWGQVAPGEASGRTGEAAPLAPWLLALTIAGAALVQASHAAVYAFGTLSWQDEGLSGGQIGILWTAGIVSEVALFAMAGTRWSGRAGATVLLLAGASAATLRWLGMAAGPGFAWLLPLQLLHGLSFGATHLGSVFMLSLLAPRALQAQAQAWLAAAWAGCMAALTSWCGARYGAWGEGIYDAMAVASAAGLVLLALAAAFPHARLRSRPGHLG